MAGVLLRYRESDLVGEISQTSHQSKKRLTAMTKRQIEHLSGEDTRKHLLSANLPDYFTEELTMPTSTGESGGGKITGKETPAKLKTLEELRWAINTYHRIVPISLTSSLLQNLERLVDHYIRDKLT